MTSPSTTVNPLLVELICRQLIDVTSPNHDVCTVTCDPDDGSLWVHLVDPAATMPAGAGLASYGLVVEVTGVDTVHISGWSPRLLPGRRQRAKQWVARLRTSRIQPTDRGAAQPTDRSVDRPTDRSVDRPTDRSVEGAALTSLRAPGQSAGADGVRGFAAVGWPTIGLAQEGSDAPDSASLLDAMNTAAETYQRLLDERIAFAEYMLTVYLTALRSRYANVPDLDAAEPVERGVDDGRAATVFERNPGIGAVA